MSRSFERTLNYSSVNEDWDTELRALQAGPGDVVLCITGSGARPLALLARTEAEVVALDRNPVQNHLLRLQVAAIESLDASTFLRWIGLEEDDPGWRLDLYRRLRPGLGHPAREYWDRHASAIAAGVLYTGRWERHFRRVSRLARRIWPVETLLAFDDLQMQQRWLERHWDSWRWRAAWWLVCDARVSRLAFGDPAFHGRLSVDPRRFLHARMRRCLETCLARDSFMISLVLSGELSRHDLPPHLTVAGLTTIRERLHRLSIVDGGVLDHLNDPATSPYSRFSLSDVPSFLGSGGFDALWRGVLRAARTGSRVAVREFLRRHPVPDGLPLRRERILERELARVDRSFAYDFIVAVVEGGCR